ncbi:hypothetical protein GCM10025867_47340 (plasmid) [Frondihabitans sucicola]|uniref:Type II secretion system protein M n=1 Tax=Frondihabitans sucicola TaxID=1268041 RepID=A0ABN6YAD4_9MICO|nr:hypothetical protein [Frondihabitans sucicola]BDZ52493.1 hypothetical protein GCM10025867_47340 [Frondihabitans sucicola]
MNLTRKQATTLIGAGVVAVIILLVAWTALFQPQFNAISAAHAKTASQQVTAKQLEAKLADLKTKAANISTAEADAQTVYDQFPTSSDQASWIAMMKNAASSSNVTADAISPSVPTLGGGTATDGTAGPAAPAATSTAPTATAPTTTTAPATAATTGAATTPTSVGATPNLATIAVTLSVTGTSSDINKFLKKVETLDQPLLVKTFSVSGSDSKLTASITGETYLSREIPVPAIAAKK